ncbi:MAG: aminoglycoside phosphotransferase family protein [Chloroflexi bacterium]|nr:aminoglycoside phosphotransferase family protein [Chloroflexota bacterium]MDA1297288.1 aminoglycoside phosphotransferase family protein [Chloroflexota bacterium]
MEQFSSRHGNELLHDFVAGILGNNIAITDRSREFGRKSITWRIEAADGAGYYLKRHEFRSHYHAETVALTQWAPLLEGSVRWTCPEVVADSPELGALIITELHGEILPDADAGIEDQIEMHRTAGWIASKIHRLDVDPRLAGNPRLYDRAMIEALLESASPYVDAETLRWAERVATRDGQFDGLPVVPTHSDFSPRNWLIHRSNSRVSLGLIDWERARPGFWLEDVQRMVNDHWLPEPMLRDAFFDGYGRKPTDEEEGQLKLICLVNALGAVSWATEHGDIGFAEFGRWALERLKSELS